MEGRVDDVGMGVRERELIVLGGEGLSFETSKG